MCQANILTCEAEEFDCACGIIACSAHGHVDESDGAEDCPNLVPEGKEFITPNLSHVAPQFVETGLPCHLRHRWGILPGEWMHGERR